MCPADQFFVRFLKLFGDTHVLFLPNAADGKIALPAPSERPFDVVMLGSYLNPESVRHRWSEKYSSDLCQVLEESADLTLSRPQISFIEALCECMKVPVAHGRIDPKSINYEEVFNDLEDYIRATDKVGILRAIKNVDIHVFGEGDWKQFAESTDSRIIPHDPIPFTQAIEIMKQSKIVLNSSPQLKYGGHERFYTAYMCGALPISAQTPYLENDYISNEEALYYQPPRWGDLDGIIAEALNDTSRRESLVEKGRSITQNKNTWAARVEHLIHELPPILDTLIGDADDE